jgi:hypothetical protein
LAGKSTVNKYSNMDLRIFMEWDNKCGLASDKIYALQESIENGFKENFYGRSIKEVTILLICRTHDFKQRKKYKKEARDFQYDILLDFFLVRNVELEEKKKLIRYQIIKITEETFSNYKFIDFDKAGFLSDFKNIVNIVEW